PVVGHGDGRAGRRHVALPLVLEDRDAPCPPGTPGPGNVCAALGLGRVHPPIYPHRIRSVLDDGNLPSDLPGRGIHRLRDDRRRRAILRHAGGRTVPSRPALPAEHLWRRSERMRGIRVRLEGLSKSFGSIAALRTLDLDIRAGELVAFLGPSGCGKTTTLLMIAGIYQPTSVVIHFGDRRVDHLHPSDRDMGMVFQPYALYPHLTLFENIAFPLRLKRQSQEEVKRRVQQTADLLGIGHLLDRRPAEVSGGQQQRTALARALVKEPQVLLLDEPLSNLDAQIRLQARSEIRRLQQDLGVTCILVTHDQAEALAMADRVAVFSEGALQQFATPDDLHAGRHRIQSWKPALLRVRRLADRGTHRVMLPGSVAFEGRRILFKYHRLLSGTGAHPPNSLSALREVVQGGAEVIEFDVH